MKIIFLDFDGVLNTPKTWGLRPLLRAVQGELVRRVSALALQTNSYIVISSTWRLYFSLEELRFILTQYGLLYAESRVIGCTSELAKGNRQDEILAWLQDSPDEITHYVILDDDTAAEGQWEKVQEHFVKVNEEIGLSDEDIQRAKEILSHGM